MKAKDLKVGMCVAVKDVTNRFGFEVYDADHKRILAVGGFSTHDDAEQAASRKREEIQRKGWRMQVYVTEQHTVQP